MQTKRSLPYLLPVILIVASGCLRSLHPLYTEQTLVFDPALVGTWAGKDTSMWTFMQTGPKAYELVYTEKDAPGRFDARLVRLGKYTFLDFFPKEPVLQNDFYKFHLLPVHTISRIWIEEKNLRLSMLDHGWPKELLDKKKLEIAHERRGNEIILTASTADLQEFVVKYADDPKAFPEPTELRRLK